MCYSLNSLKLSVPLISCKKNPGNQRNGESPSGKTESVCKVHFECRGGGGEREREGERSQSLDSGGSKLRRPRLRTMDTVPKTRARPPIPSFHARMEWMHKSRHSSPNRNTLRRRTAHPKIASEFTGEAQCKAIHGIGRRARAAAEQRDREGLPRFWGPWLAERRIRTSITDRRHRLFSCPGTSELPSA